MKPLIIYHGDCNDGFGAALAAYLKYGDKAQYIPGMYDGFVPEVTGRDVLIFDYHFKHDVLIEMHSKANSLLLLDHHATVMDSLSDLPYAQFDINKSGAMLAWEYFFKDSAPEMFYWLQDRDLWLNQYPESNSFFYYLNSHPYDLKVWAQIYYDLQDNNKRDSILNTGNQIYSYYKIQLELLLKHHAKEIIIDGVKGWIINTNKMFATEAGSILARRYNTFALIWSVNEKNMVGCSVRSVAECSARKIAEKYGGGGHEHASKFRMSINQFMDEFLTKH